MAKRNNEPTFSNDRAKVRVFFAELEGGNESVQEALRTMASAMSRPVQVVSEQVAPSRASPLLEEPHTHGVSKSLEEVPDFNSIEESGISPNPRKARGTGARDRNSGLELVPDLNFRPDGKIGLREIFAEKHPANDIEAILLFVYYLEQNMSIGKIGAAHVMTAFKDVGRPIPADIRQAVRNIKKQKGWLKFADIDDLKITTQGGNFVEHDMGKNS